MGKRIHIHIHTINTTLTYKCIYLYTLTLYIHIDTFLTLICQPYVRCQLKIKM